MKKSLKYCVFVPIVSLVIFLGSCGGNGEEEIHLSDGMGRDGQAQNGLATTDPVLIEIYSLESKVAADTAFDRTRTLRLFKAYQEYYNRHPKDTVALNYLFEAANLAQKLDKHQRAIELFINFQDGFPTSHRCDEAVYNIAYIYDARIGNKEKAKLYYNKVIELYPTSMWAEQARGALQIVNMSDEELLKFLEEKNK
ncbi:MAG: tetratricopeptide repeat protein [Flavobacteriales bacterium]